MQIAADERDEANGEIEMLQSQIHKQGKELNMSVQLLSEKKAELQNTESRCKKLEDQEIQVKANNQRLNDELKTLRDEISESKKRTTTFGDKSRIYKAKLNEAIAEQQALFIRSRDLYKECQEELQKEKSSRAAQALEIDKALDESLKKREDLKQCFQEYRSVAEQENNTSMVLFTICSSCLSTDYLLQRPSSLSNFGRRWRKGRQRLSGKKRPWSNYAIISMSKRRFTSPWKDWRLGFKTWWMLG